MNENNISNCVKQNKKKNLYQKNANLYSAGTSLKTTG